MMQSLNQKRNFNAFKMCQLVLIFICLILLSACNLLQETTKPKPSLTKQLILCESGQQTDDFEEFCEADAWLEYMLQVQPLSWKERFERINQLDDEISSIVKKMLLSQGVETPFQHRLRAQNWLARITNQSSTDMQILLTQVIYENSKQLLEFESAITLLSRVNARQEKTIEEFSTQIADQGSQISDLQLQILECEQQINKQKDQVDQLLKIESDLIEQNRKENR